MNPIKKTSLTLTTYNLTGLFNYLLSKEAPVNEADILRHFTGESLPFGTADLFPIHFSLYHALYRLRSKSGTEGYYLHLDPMRIRLIALPGREQCFHYFPEKGCFCSDNSEQESYCKYHIKLYADNYNRLTFDPLLDFYINPENIAFGESELLEKLLNGIAVYSFRKGEIDQALKFFGLTSPNKKIVNRRYRELAKRYHPDKQNGNSRMMKMLNSSYQVLLEVFVV